MSDRGSEPTGKVSVQPWMAAAETVAVMAALTADGGEARRAMETSDLRVGGGDSGLCSTIQAGWMFGSW